jgi:hypothetical protein
MSAGVELPSERTARREAKRQAARGLFTRLFTRHVWGGDYVVDKKRVMLAVLVSSAVGMTLLVVIASSSLRRPQATAQETPGPVTDAAQQPAPAPSPELAAQPAEPQEPVASATPSATQQPPAPPRVPPPVFPAEPGPEAPLPPPPGVPSGTGLGFGGPQFTVVSGQPQGPSFMAAERGGAGGAVFTGAAQDRPSQQAQAQAPAAEEGRLHAPALQAAPAAPLPGTQVPAVLQTAVYLPQGLAEAPVVARTDPGGAWCGRQGCPGVTWIGTARSSGSAVQVTFTSAVTDDGRQVSVQAAALDESGAAVLRARTSVVPQDLASSIAAAAIGGAADYLQRVMDQRNVTITNGFAVITQQGAPDLGAAVGTRVLRLFDPGPQQSALTRVVELDRGIRIKVLVLAWRGS